MRDDLISRIAVMRSLTAEYNRKRTGDGLRLAWIEKAVDDVPASASSCWIPANKKTPETDERVLCQTRTKKGAANFVIGYYADGRWICGMNSNVVAWRPLPDAYEEEDDTNE